jgi:hypothetical protein
MDVIFLPCRDPLYRAKLIEVLRKCQYHVPDYIVYALRDHPVRAVSLTRNLLTADMYYYDSEHPDVPRILVRHFLQGVDDEYNPNSVP